MECAQVEGHWPEYLDGTLEPSAVRALDAHMAVCRACRERWRGLEFVRQSLCSLPEETPPAGMRERFALQLEREALASGAAVDSARFEPVVPVSPDSYMRRPWVTATLAFAALAAAFALGVWTAGRPDSRLNALEGQVDDLEQLVAVSMLGQRSAAERLKGVTFSSELPSPTPELVSALLDTLKYDSSPNVRLRAVDVLAGLGDDASVRAGVVKALGEPQSPMVQLALIDLLVDLRETESVGVLAELASDESERAEVREHAAWGLGQLAAGSFE
jgi:Putative zinc-finger